LREGGKGFESSNAIWDREIVGDSAPVLVHTLAGQPHGMICNLLRQRGMLEEGDAHVMLYAWGANSYIPWHTDGRHSGAVTVYLNDRWDPEWGGHFLYKTQDGEIASPLVPRFNLGVVVGCDIPHATTRVEGIAPEARYSLQVFRKKLSV